MFVFSPSEITQRKAVNPAHPRISPRLLEEIIAYRQLEGEYRNEDIRRIMKELITSLDDKLQNEISKYSPYDIVINLLRVLDELYRMSAIEEVKMAQNSAPHNVDIARETYRRLGTTGIVGQVLERIVEVALREHSTSSAFSTIQNLIGLFELGYELALTNAALESFLCIWFEKDTLSIAKNSWHLECGDIDAERVGKIGYEIGKERSRKSREAFSPDIEGLNPAEFIYALQALRTNKDKAAPTKLGADLDELILAVDDKHRIQFGHSFTERLIAQFYLGEPSTDLPEELAFEDQVIRFLCNKMEVSEELAHSILQVLCLSGESIRDEKAAPLQFRRIHRLMRRPIPRFMVGNRAILFLSGAFIGRGMQNLIAEYMGETHPELENTEIKKIVGRLNQDYSEFFVRERIAKKLGDFGFKVKCHTKRIGTWNLEVPEIGEIDILAAKPRDDKLIIGECKFSALPDIHVRQMRRDFSAYMKEYSGYRDKLERKVRWVSEHTAEVIEFIGLEKPLVPVHCVPIFFTNFYTPASAIITNVPFVQEHELENWYRTI